MSVILNSKKIIVHMMRIISNSQYYTWYPRRWTILLHRSDPGITRGSIERYFKHPPANVQSRSNISRWTKFSSCSSFAIRSRDIGRATKDSIQSRGVTCSRFRVLRVVYGEVHVALGSKQPAMIYEGTLCKSTIESNMPGERGETRTVFAEYYSRRGILK